MLSLEGVSFRYRHGDSPALQDISLHIAAGEVVGIVGPNGAGKTTLCLTLNGLIPHAVRGSLTGRVTVGGVDTATVQVHELARQVGIVLQNPETQFFGESVEEELAFGPENLCLPTEEIEQRIVASLATVGVAALRDRFPYHLSGGQKQRVAIATALAMQPRVLVLDEPTSELDPQGKQEVLAAIGSLHRELGQTVMIVSHETDELVPIVNRVVALSADGRLVADGSPAEVLGGSLPAILGLRQPQLFELRQDRPGPPPLTVEQAATRLRGGLRFGAVPPRETGVAADAPMAIECRDLRYAYANGVEALRGIDLRMRRGEFVAIMGQNGSGKTTLSKHLNGLLRPRSGQVTVAGLDAAKTGTADMARRVGYAFQNPDHQLFASSVAEEFAFGLRNIGVPASEIRERTDAALAQAGLHLAPDTYPHFLGKGQRQRLALASILAMRPEILVIDEPTTGQDWRNAQATMQTLEALNRDGMTIVFVTHDSRLVAEHAQRVVVMADGSIIADGDPAEVFHDRVAMQRASIRPPPVMQLVAALSDNPAKTGVRTVADFRAAWVAA
jgi:energy-coupling factor transporter ATP-binding protein EcfA2